MVSKGKELNQTSDTSTWISGADILSNIPELLAAKNALQEGTQEPVDQSECKETELESGKLLLSSDHPFEQQEGETTNKLAEIINSAEELKNAETETAEELSQNEEITEVKQTDTLEQVASDCLPTKDLATTEELPPAKPRRQLTVEPDIVASTKKPVPARPPPPANVPPPRPPPPARPAPPPRKKKSELDFEVQKSSGLDGKYSH